MYLFFQIKFSVRLVRRMTLFSAIGLLSIMNLTLISITVVVVDVKNLKVAVYFEISITFHDPPRFLLRPIVSETLH